MCAPVTGPLIPLKVMLAANVFAVVSRVIVATPEPVEEFGGTSF